MEIISINQIRYASALRRLMAFIIDRLAISVLVTIVFRQILGLPFEIDTDTFWIGLHPWQNYFALNILKEMLILAYFAGMESSKYQATFGKIVMGIRVTDKNNDAISFGKALLRNLSKYFSALILGIGYIMIIFDDKKQGLHDKIADTVVLKT